MTTYVYQMYNKKKHILPFQEGIMDFGCNIY